MATKKTATPTNGGKQVFVSQEALDAIEGLQFEMQNIDIEHARLYGIGAKGSFSRVIEKLAKQGLFTPQVKEAE